MAIKRQPPPPPWPEQAHIDIGALAERVSGMENAVGRIVDQLDAFGKKLDGRAPNLWGVIGGVVAMLTLGGGVLYQALAPISAQTARDGDHIDKLADTVGKMSHAVVWRDDFHDYAKQTSADMQRLADRERSDQDAADAAMRTLTAIVARLDERTKINHEDEVRADDRMLMRVDSIDLQQVKRPEIEAANRALGERIDELSKREGDTRALLESLFPPADMIKEIWASIHAMLGGSGSEKK